MRECAIRREAVAQGAGDVDRYNEDAGGAGGDGVSVPWDRGREVAGDE